MDSRKEFCKISGRSSHFSIFSADFQTVRRQLSAKVRHLIAENYQLQKQAICN
jgi:hypothetical protein